MKPLIINDSEETISDSTVEQWCKGIVKELRSRSILTPQNEKNEISVVFLKEIDAKHLNWNHRQRDYATDILSFQTDDPESLGELVMCPLILRKQCKEHKVTFEEELGYLMLHGTLHLLGYDHEKSEDDARKMMSLQDEIFEILRAPPKKTKPAPKAKAEPAKSVKATVVKGAKKAAPAKKVEKAPAKKAVSAKAAKATPAKKAKKK